MFVGWDWRRSSGETKHKGPFRGRIKIVDPGPGKMRYTQTPSRQKRYLFAMYSPTYWPTVVGSSRMMRPCVGELGKTSSGYCETYA